MISLDMRTVLISFVLINIVSTIVVTYLWIQYKKRYKGLHLLAFAFFLQLVAYSLILLRGFIPTWISLDVANGLSVTGLVLGFRGFNLYAEAKCHEIQNYVLLVLLAAVHLWFKFVAPDPSARYLIIYGASFLFFSQYAWMLLFGVPKKMRQLTRLTGYVFIAFCIVAAIKITDFLISNRQPDNYLEADKLESALMMVYQMLIIILTFSISLMLSRHLLQHIIKEEEKFFISFNTAPNAIALTSYPDGKITEVNKAFLDILGYELSEVIDKTNSDLGTWKHEKEKEEIFLELERTGTYHKKEFEFRRKSGETFTGLLSAKIIMIGNQKYMISSVYDITERKNFQDLIRRERNLLRTLLDHLPDPVTIKDLEGRYLLNNKAHLQVIGADTQEEVIGKTTFDYFPEEDAIQYDSDDKNVLRTGRMIIDKVECAEHAETGFPYWHMTSKIPIRDDDGKSIQILTISHDITERKRAEDALRESDEFNRSLLRTIPFGMDVVDEAGTILFMSENYRKLFGNDAVGKKCWEIYRDDKMRCKDCPINFGIRTGVTEIYESHGIMGGKIFDIYHTGMMFHGHKAMLEIFHDITERKRTENDLIRSKEKAEESDKLKTAFLHNISHEIRTPMNAIVGFSNLLREPGLTKEEHDNYTDIISRSSNHLLSIVNDVIEISTVEAGRLRCSVSNVDINSILNDLLRQFREKASERKLQLCLQIPESDFSDLQTDGTKLTQIITNLLNNAFKFTEKGQISFGFTIQDNTLEFFVSDTGIGIEPDQQQRIFDRFYQVDNTVTRMHEGTGIGLSISKAYVELLGGKLWLKSSSGKGSVFYFTVPYPSRELPLVI